MGFITTMRPDCSLITTDSIGSNSSKGKLWKFELQKLANETGLEITALHFPLGTSKSNKIEHRLFSYTSKNWRARPLINYQVIIKLISSTKTKTGLNVECAIDKDYYRTGIKISVKQMHKINILRVHCMESGIIQLPQNNSQFIW